MRHPLNVLLRIGRSDADRLSLLGDLEETYRMHVRPNRFWIGAQGWYAREVLAAAGCSLRDGGRPKLRSGAMSDVRYALRRWRRRPAFAMTAIFTLALGIAAATATFSIIDAVLLRPLPWKDPETLVLVHGVYPGRRGNPATATTWNRGVLTYSAWDALRGSSAFTDVAVWRTSSRLDTTLGEDRSDIVQTAHVSSNFLPLLGYRMSLGRYFNEREDSVFNDSIVLTHESWQRRFAGRTDIINQRVMLGAASSGDRLPKTIVGVTEPGFRFDGDPPEILQPIGISAQASREYANASLRVVARLNPGTTADVAESMAASAVSGTPMREPHTVRVVLLADEHLGSSRKPLWVLFGGAGLLLLIACANVAGLLVGEARVRRHEIAVRAALGGSRARVVRQLVIEHVMMAACGVALGLVCAAWLIGMIVAVAPEGVPRIDTVNVDLRAALFAIGAGLATLVIFGVAPALSLARTPVVQTLAEGGREGAVGRYLGQRTVVTAEIALALVLLTGAGLFAETMLRLTSQPLGFDPRELVVVSTTFTGAHWGDPSRIRAARANSERDFGKLMERLARETSNARNDQVFERLSALPGIVHVAGASAMPFLAPQVRIPIVLDGRPDAERHDALMQNVSERYFDAMRTRLLSGRVFTKADQPGASAAAVVSREFERRFFPTGAVDRRFRYVYGANYEISSHFHVVGVVDDVKRQEFSDDEWPAFYSFDRQHAGRLAQFAVRTSSDPDSVLSSVREAIKQVTPQLVVTSMTRMEERVARSIAEERFRAMLSSLFGGMALLLATVGLYGLIARRAADRRREFGVRVALGARPSDVRGLVIKDAVLLITLGLAVGLPAAYAAAQITRTLLYGVSASSPHVFAITSGLLVSVAIAASLLPARRASLADPISALKS